MIRAYPVFLAAAIILLCVLMLVAVGNGPSDIDALTIVQIVLNAITGDSNAQGLAAVEAWQSVVIEQVRLPRVLVAALVGAALALCGAVLQGLFRNPLASPSVLGVSSGAGLGAVIAIFLGLSAVNMWALPVFAFIGAGITLFLVYYIATYQGNTPISTLLLSGVAVSSFNIAMTSLILALAMQNWEVGRSIAYWTMGGLDGRGWQHVWIILPVFVITAGFILSYRRDLDMMLVGEIHASTVGVDVRRVRLYLLTATALLTGAAVSVAGGIGFVGLVVPHVTRLLVGPHHRYLLPMSTILGAMVLVFADLLIRGDSSYTVIPLGVVTSAMGAPFFLFLLLKQRRLIQ